MGWGGARRVIAPGACGEWLDGQDVDAVGEGVVLWAEQGQVGEGGGAVLGVGDEVVGV